MIKEIEGLIEMYKGMLKTCSDHGWNMSDEQAAITAAETMLKRARVFEGIVVDGAVEGEPCYVHNEKTHWDSNVLHGLLDKRVRIIVIPEAENAE